MVLGIGVGATVSECYTWATQYGLTHPVLSDENSVVFNLFSTGYAPQFAVIDGYMDLRYTVDTFDEQAVRTQINLNLPTIFLFFHDGMPDTEETFVPYHMVTGLVSPAAVSPGFPVIFWNTTGTPPFTPVEMTIETRDLYGGEIPAQPLDTEVYYYLYAQNQEARTTIHPPLAPVDLLSFRVGIDVTPPIIDHNPYDFFPIELWPMELEARVTDNLGVDQVSIEYRVNGGAVQSTPMIDEGDDVYSAVIDSVVAVGDLLEYRIVADDAAGVPNQAAAPPSGYFEVDIGNRIGALVFDPDPNHSSGPNLQSYLAFHGLTTDYSVTLQDDLIRYWSVFICLGIFSDNHVLSQQEGALLAEFLDRGGCVYMEGGDTWYYDPPTAAHDYFGITGAADGASDTGPVSGVTGTFTEGMTFNYGGENNWMDHLTPSGGAFAVINNLSPAYTNAVANNACSYRTVGASFELNGLVDGSGPSTKEELVSRILQFFGLLYVTPTPYHSPAPPTETPTPTPYRSPTPTMTPTVTRTPTPPSPTITPTTPPDTPTAVPPTISPTTVPTLPTGGPFLALQLNQQSFQPGDRFLLELDLENWSATVVCEEYIILDAFGVYFFWPDWSGDLDFLLITCNAPSHETAIILDFLWPSGAGTAQNLAFWAALLRPGTTEVFDIDNVSFDYYE
ncbi:hypothetical protein JW905_16210 [bacterium]|nr:hypothetical protein [candidate division CSSED10-310 bacterium]